MILFQNNRIKKEIEIMKKIIVILLATCLLCTGLIGCTSRQSTRTSQNISLEADNFRVLRRLTVINLRSDTPLFELVGLFSLSDESNRLVITVKTDANNYKKHFIAKGEWIFWDVEDLSGSDVNTFRYEVNILPETFIPFDIVQKY